MSRFTLPKKASRTPDLLALRRNLITAMWLDYKLFGYITEEVKALQQRIVREKQGKVLKFPEVGRKKAA